MPTLRRSLSRLLPLVALVSLSALPAFGQGGLGAMRGTITDKTGASVPGAKVASVHVETNTKTEVVSDTTGAYTVLQLRPGTYEVQVEAAGFKKMSRQGILIQVGDSLVVDIYAGSGRSDGISDGDWRGTPDPHDRRADGRSH